MYNTSQTNGKVAFKMRKHSIIKQVSLFLAIALCIGFAGGALLTRRTTAAAETDGSTTDL